MPIYVDIEGNGLADTVTKIWCISVLSGESGEVVTYGPNQIQEAVDYLNTQDWHVFHNGIGFDFLALEKLTNYKRPEHYIDSLILSRLCFNTLKEMDFDNPDPAIKGLEGSHSLEAWGIRLGGEQKSDFAKDDDKLWLTYDPEMLERCAGDVRITHKLVMKCMEAGYSQESLDLEQEHAIICQQMQDNGFPFDTGKAIDLRDKLLDRKAQLTKEADKLIPPVATPMKTVAYWTNRWPNGTVSFYDTKGEAETDRKQRKLRPAQVVLRPGPKRVKWEHFNPGSRPQVRKVLHEKYGWRSPELTKKGTEVQKKSKQPVYNLALEYGKLDESTMKGIDYPIGKVSYEYLMIGKRLGQLSVGDKGWLKLVKDDGCIHGGYIPCHCSTHRSASVGPNLQQVTGTDKPYGTEMRALFHAGKCLNGRQRVLVGCDLNAIEGRILAHYLDCLGFAQFKNMILTGADVHAANAECMSHEIGVEVSRKGSKSCYYALMYSAGDEKLGWTASRDNPTVRTKYNELFSHLRTSMSEAKASKEAYKDIGRKVREGLMQATPGLKVLINTVQQQIKSNGYLSPLDDRRWRCRSEHSAFNLLIQGVGGIVFRRWCLLVDECLKNIRVPFWWISEIHDELITACYPEDSLIVRAVMEEMAVKAGEYYSLRLPTPAEAKCAYNWEGTH